MAVEDDRPPDADLASREPTLEDLRDLCRALNERSAQYVVIGGFAIRAAGYNRRTMDVDLLVVDGVPIPFASPRLLWRMKAVTRRAKDAGDLVFLRYWFTERGEEPPRP